MVSIVDRQVEVEEVRAEGGCLRMLRQYESWVRQDAKCGMWEVETWAAVSEENRRRRGYVLDSSSLIAVVGCRDESASTGPEDDLTGGQ